MAGSLRNYPRLEISGIGLEGQKNLCKFISEDNAAAVFSFIGYYSSLQDLCKFPEACSAVMYIVNVFLKQQRKNKDLLLVLPLTRVAVAVYAILVRSKHFMLENQDLEQLASSAWMEVNDALPLDSRGTGLADECHYDATSFFDARIYS